MTFNIDLFLESIKKISTEGSYPALQFYGEQVKSIYLRLQEILSSTDPSRVRSMAILFQHVDLNVFTEEEIENISLAPSMDRLAQILSTVEVKGEEKLLKKNKFYFDNQSLAVYQSVDSTKINNLFFDNAFAIYAVHSGQTLKDFLYSLVM